MSGTVLLALDESACQCIDDVKETLSYVVDAALTQASESDAKRMRQQYKAVQHDLNELLKCIRYVYKEGLHD